MRRCYAAAAVALVLCLIPSPGQTPQRSEKRRPEVFNPETAPLKVKLSPGRRYTRVENHSEKSVKGYQLGCVVKENAKITVKFAFDVRHVELKPLDLPGGSMYSESYGTEQSGLWQCRQTSTKLAVIEVLFADGTIWKITEPADGPATSPPAP